MSATPDPFDLLAAMAAAPDHRELEPGDLPQADALLERIVATVPIDAAPTRRRARWAAAAAVVAAVAAGGSVAAVWGREPADALSVSCYSDASTTPRVIVGLVGDGGDAIAQCAPAWADGRLGRAGAPSLAACVDARGSLVVVPGADDTCAALGWAPSADTSERRRIAAAVANSVPIEMTSHCRSDADEAVKTVEQLLDGAGADGWAVVTTPSNGPTDGLCFMAAVDGVTETVTLTAVALPGN